MSSLDDPFSLGEELADGLAELGDSMKRRSPRFRPDVVRYLFEQSWQKVRSERGEEKALLGLWELQLETISGGLFSVADNRWRRGKSYPDRYFPTLWLHVVPELAERSDAWFEQTVSLFNLGERLAVASRPLANAVAQKLEEESSSLAAAFEPTLRKLLSHCGVLPAEPNTGDGYEHFASIELAESEPSFLAGSMELSAAGVLWVYEANSTRALVATLTIAGAELQGIHAALDPPPANLRTRVGSRDYRAVPGALLTAEAGKEHKHLAPVIAPIALAANQSGLVAIADGLRQRVVLLRPA